MSKIIPLTQGQIAIVCDCHYHLVKDYKWCALWKACKRQFEAVRSSSKEERSLGAAHNIPMHVVINGTPKGFQTDHIDNCSLNNQCANLRTATHSENQHNRSKPSNNTSGFKGVSWHKKHKKWAAHIKLNRKLMYLGLFDTASSAARSYDEAAREYHGEFAKTNF